jgi:lysozyme family protein
MSAFDEAIEHTLIFEGGYVNDPDDPGGETNYGITKSTARAYGYDGPMRDITLTQATAIYRMGYWDRLDLDSIAYTSRIVARFIFDMAVNHGTRNATKIAQRAVRAVGKNILVDGQWGPNTSHAVKTSARDYPEATLGALKGERYNFYMRIVARNATMKKFLRGWLKRVA